MSSTPPGHITRAPLPTASAWNVLVARDEVSRQAHEAAVAEETAARAALRAAEVEVEMAQGLLVQARGELARAEADLASAGTAPQQIAVTEAEAQAAAARLAQAEAAVDRARRDLEYTQVRSPATGIVSHKRIETGQYVREGQPMLAVVDLVDVWVVANFKETQLEHMRVGQVAKVAIDAYPSDDLEGRVESVGAATGSRFSLLPADNATGNFVKVVQRVPVKIALEGADIASATAAGRPLRPGMSVVATVRLGTEDPASNSLSSASR